MRILRTLQLAAVVASALLMPLLAWAAGAVPVYAPPVVHTPPPIVSPSITLTPSVPLTPPVSIAPTVKAPVLTPASPSYAVPGGGCGDSGREKCEEPHAHAHAHEGCSSDHEVEVCLSTCPATGLKQCDCHWECRN